MTEHATDCTCRPSDEHGFIIGGSCVKKFGREALERLKAELYPADPGTSVTHGSEPRDTTP